MSSRIEPYFNGKKSSTTGQAIKSANIEVYENKEDWNEIIKEAKSIKRSDVKSIWDALDHMNNLFKDKDEQFKNSVNSVIQYYQTTGILENSSAKISANNCYYNVNDRTCVSLLGEVCKEISYGKKVTFVINSIKESTEILHLLIKLTQSMQQGLYNLIIKDGLKLAPYVFRLNDNVQQNNQMSVFVVFRESDYVSAIECLPSVLNTTNYKNCLFLVQESQIKVVKELFDRLWPKLIDGPKQFAKNFKYELVNYDLNTILDQNEDENINENKISLLAFRDKFEVLKLLNHCQKLPFVSIWNRNLSICSFLAQNISKTNLFWFNSVLKYSPSIPLINFVQSKFLSKDLHFDEILNLTIEESKNYKVLENFFTKKLTKREPFEMINLISSILISNQFQNQSTTLEYAKNFYHNLVNLNETKDGIFTTKHYPIGFVLLSIDDDQNLSELFNLIVSCILSNNLVYLSIKKELTNRHSIKQFIDYFSGTYFKSMLIVDENCDLIDQKLKSMIKYANQHIGTYIKYSEQKDNVNFHYLEHKLFHSKTVFKPTDVHDNTI